MPHGCELQISQGGRGTVRQVEGAIICKAMEQKLRKSKICKYIEKKPYPTTKRELATMRSSRRMDWEAFE